ncbi:MAG: methylated-DNA--[protein]-cysteine S-methyltransferase [Desulfobacterales bacterium]
MNPPAAKHHVITETPLGFAGVIYRSAPFQLVEILLPQPQRDGLRAQLQAAGAPQAGQDPNALAVARAIRDYFNGRQPDPPWPPWEWLDLSALTALQQAALSATARIPYGQTRTYHEVAQAAGRPKAARATGTALAKNPYPILIPCHRVIRSDGSCGQFGGGTQLKQAMLALERQTVAAGATLDAND